jgi:TatD DNase family protein
MLVDSHCHIEGAKFDADRAAVLKRARDSGVEAILAIGNGSGPDEADCAVRLSERFDEPLTGSDSTPRIFATVGVHPHEAKLVSDKHYPHLEWVAQNYRVIAFGEIGLDYFYDHSARDIQRLVLVKQLEVASAAKLPVVIHCRPSEADPEDAWHDLFDILRRRWAASGLGGVLHCFTGTVEHARAAMDLGFMISFAGNVSFPKAAGIRDAARQLPLERMLIETDSPYLAPVPHRGKRNEPAFVRDVARVIAELRGIEAEQVASATTNNFYEFFKTKRIAQHGGRSEAQ